MIVVENCDEKIYNIVVDASCFFATQLLPIKSLNRSQIKIVFEDGFINEDGFVGQCLKKNRFDYEITIEPTMNLQSILLTIAHEIVHVNQYMRGFLRETYETYSIWRGQKYSSNQYYMFPWEIEANGVSIALYEHFVDTFNYRNEDWYFDSSFI